MTIRHLSRRAALLGAVASLSGCSALSALSGSRTALDTFDLAPASGTVTGSRSSRTLVVARPEAPAAIATDRILVRPDPRSVTYLPGARWSDDVPLLLQSLLIRSVAGTGRIGYVGQVENGPLAERVLLARIDAFQIEADPARNLIARVDMELFLLNDVDQTLIASRRVAGSAPAASDSAPAVVAAIQAVMDELLPAIADWVVRS
ncbi:ABC-type transport auxiliary lipoprotein family protein [uncultured Paracoccus sp.]|uniref:ABC-type transport auxiliary lipoprotein family protein n=1 Tax=uncultured Paracoccus sp. TaxID=189685 RepID=UPI00262A8AC2|nr:ABC-type transport auxiliary lipoprotein family protein [uncultured Paracoccus sp.]